MSDKFIKMKTEFKNLPKEERDNIIKTAVIKILIIVGVSGFLSGFTIKSIMSALALKKGGIIYYGFFTPIGLTTTIIVAILIGSFYFLLVTRKKLTNVVVSTDERGVSYLKNSANGSSAWMDDEEARVAYNVGKVMDTNTTIYGQLTEGGSQVVSYKYPEYGGTGDQNLLLIGSPGTGKSYAYVRTEIIQSIRRGDSIICTDPSGELQGSMAQFAEDNGYKVKVLNLLDPSYSDFWDCLTEVINPATERLDSTRLNTFVSIYMTNCEAPGAKPDPFWSGAQSNVLKATIGITSWQRESYILNQFRELYKQVALSDPDRFTNADNKIKDMVSFVACKEMILNAAKENNFDLDDIQYLIDRIEAQAPKFNMEQVFGNLMNFSEVEDIVSTMPIYHPGKLAYVTFNQSSDQVKQSSLMGMQLKMQIFSDDKITSVLSHEGINLSQMNREKTAVFVIMSDKSAELKPIASLFFSFFFKDVQDTWDKYQQIADSKGEDNPCLKTTVMLDEFFSIGVIGGDPQSFGITMSNSRKRQLHINIVVQNITQLDALYGPEISSVIKTCCGTNLFLGCNDEDTAKYVSEFMCGEATVLSERHAESQSVFGEFNSRFRDVQFTSSARALLTVEEAKSWRDKVLVSKRGEHPIRLNPFPWSDHPLASKVVKTNIYERIVCLDQRLEEMEAIERASRIDVDEEIMNIKPISPFGDEFVEVVKPKQNVQTKLPIEEEEKEEKPKTNKKKSKTKKSKDNKTGAERKQESLAGAKKKATAINSGLKTNSETKQADDDFDSGDISIL